MTRKFFGWLPRPHRDRAVRPRRAEPRRSLPTLEALEDRTLPDAAPTLRVVPERFLDAVYRDVLGRPADASGLASWGDLLRQGVGPVEVVAGILGSAESHLRTLDDLYNMLLGRSADESGQAVFSAFLGQGGTREQVVAHLLASPEYGARAGGTDAGFLDAAYRNVLGRAPDPFGLDVFGRALAAGVSRYDVAWGIVTSPEGRERWVEGLYQRHLLRSADPAGAAAWVGLLQQQSDPNLVVAGLLASPEYQDGVSRGTLGEDLRPEPLAECFVHGGGHPCDFNDMPLYAPNCPDGDCNSGGGAGGGGGAVGGLTGGGVIGRPLRLGGLLPGTVQMEGATDGRRGGHELLKLTSPLQVSQFPDGGLRVSPAGVRYANGEIDQAACDLSSDGFGGPWGQTRDWTNMWSAPVNFNGNGVMVRERPYLVRDDAGGVIAITSGVGRRDFPSDGAGGYQSPPYVSEQLTANGGASELALTDSAGDTLSFYDFSTGTASQLRGQFKRYTDRNGNTVTVQGYTSLGLPTEVRWSSGGITESYLYTYYGSGTTAGLLQNVTLRRDTGGGFATVRQVDYAYYDGTQSHGNVKDLRTAVIKDAAGTVLDTKYYRYYTGETGGYVGGLKYVFGPQSYARLQAAYSDPTTATDAQVAPYADAYYEYDTGQRVTKAVIQGAGCSSCSGGQGTYTYSYASSSFNPTDYNTWTTKTVETLPDGNQNIVYSNTLGKVMLAVFQSGSQSWANFFQYDSSARVVLVADPSAVTGYDETKPDLLNKVSGNYQYLSDSAGLVETVSYYASTTATDSTAGGAASYLQQLSLQQGETGSAIPQQTLQYYAHSNGSGTTVYPVATNTVYRNPDGTGAETTTYSYTWFTSSTLPQSVTVTQPMVTTAQNGPGTADVVTIYLDSRGRPTWQKDGDSFLHYTEYDTATGAVSKTIVDVNTSQTGDFIGLPTGWSTPTGGGLHLKTLDEIDGLGRTTKLTDPNGNITYTVYNDPNHEVRVYAGWQTATNTPTGPTQVWREDRQFTTGYTETLTMSAAPAVSGGRPTGTEAVSVVQTLSRSYVSAGGQVTRHDAYFNLGGLTYSTALYPGTANTNYYTTLLDYDDRGRPDRRQLPTGTIYRTVWDGLSRAVSQWVGLDDTPTSGEWSPTNTVGTDLVKVSENVYDGGGVGDSNLTQTTQFPGGSADNRVSQTYYDWRDRVVASKQGVQATEATDVQRPIIYYELDNLGEVTAQEQYDGDNVTITDGNGDGVPDKPSSSVLRARATTSYDEQGRPYRAQVSSVDQSNGTISTNGLTTDLWFDHRGLWIKQAVPGGLVQKMTYDGAGRVTKTYATDGGGDSGWGDAGTVTGDTVLTQSESQYDADGNVLLTITKDRFHDETATGELGNATTAPKARVSYAALYYDAANRRTAAVDVGTNGGSTYTRPSGVPSRSDTVLVTDQTYNAAGWVETVTDPRGIAGKVYYDNLGRVTKTIQAYVDGTPSNQDDKTTEYTYDGSGHILTLKAYLTGSSYEKTQWVYGVSTGTGSDFNCNDCLAAIRYPDKTTGDPSTSEQETFTVNALQQRKTYADRNGSTHTYSYDVMGRLTADAVTALGTGVDGAVRRLTTAYDTAGRAYLFTSYDAASGGNIVNQVQQVYNGLGQLVTEYQAHSGAVNTGTTPKVQYAYSEMAGGANHSRLVSMTYPNGRVLNYNYNTGLDSSISRLSSLSDSSATLETYAYLGLGTVVKRGHPQPGVDLTYIKQAGESNGDAGDQYTGLDRFGRVVDQRWLVASTGTATDRFKYGYDRDGNRLYRTNELNHSFDELYHANGASNGYDLLNQLTDFRRGTLSDVNSDGVPDTVATASRTQTWTFDALGNWTTLTTDSTGVNRTHNKQNQVTTVGGASLVFDANGNTTTDENGKTLVYDAWNRLVAYKNGMATLESFQYDALNRRTVENPGTARDLYYSNQWQVLEERVGTQVQLQYVWSPVYVDALVERDRDADGQIGNGLEEKLYVQQDANWDVNTVLTASGAVQERYVEDPYGQTTVLAADWSTRSATLFAWLYLHQGGRLDNPSGSFLFRLREASPALGRWWQQDPISYVAGDSNLYCDERNNPTSLLDTYGLRSKKPKYTPPKPGQPGIWGEDPRKSCKKDAKWIICERSHWSWRYTLRCDYMIKTPEGENASDELIRYLNSLPDQSIANLWVCGHGGDGVQCLNTLTTDEQLKVIASKLKPGSHIIIFSCCGARNAKFCQTVADTCQATVVANTGDVWNWWNPDTGQWMYFPPNKDGVVDPGGVPPPNPKK
jgi:RHS repeat-associated protein